MAANAKVTGNVEYRAGDGPLILIPQGPIEIQLAPDSAVLSWGDAGSMQTTDSPCSRSRRRTPVREA